MLRNTCNSSVVTLPDRAADATPAPSSWQAARAAGRGGIFPYLDCTQGFSQGLWEAGVRGHLVGRAFALALVICGVVAGQAHAMRTMCNVPIKTGDGLTLRANVWLPDQEGRYPTILTGTRYNKDTPHPPRQAGSRSGRIPPAGTTP